MGVQDDITIRLSAQRALLTHVTSQLRAVSVDIDPSQRRVWVRFVFDGEPLEAAREAASCAATEVVADYPDWKVAEEYVSTPAPGQMAHRRLLVYHRCEDQW
jgi:hypothetical protein